MDKVLLTPEERLAIHEEVFKDGYFSQAKMDKAIEDEDKAQCLKLLEWLNEPCHEHNYCHRDFDDNGTAVDVDVERRECPECMVLLELKLKERV
jgi:hypothetical protein